MGVFKRVLRGIKKAASDAKKLFAYTADWTADKIQTATGVKESRSHISCLKELALEFKEKVSAAILRVNETIKTFNRAIEKLNTVRNMAVKSNIDVLHTFLCKFGNCKPAGSYMEEHQKLPEKFPQQEFDSIENYIANVDWTNEEVFRETFFRSPIGIKLKTRKQNISLREHIQELCLQTEETTKQLQLREFTTKQETEICGIYVDNVVFISEFISTHILPELELIEAFFQAEKIKNELLCSKNNFENISFSYNIKSIANTKYHRHYQFVKNAVAFYVLACCIYNTPVLSNLLEKKTTEKDLQRLKNERGIISKQSQALCDTMQIRRGD